MVSLMYLKVREIDSFNMVSFGLALTKKRCSTLLV